MKYKKSEYVPRLIDRKIDTYLSVFGAICIDGPKWCGKTWTSTNHTKTQTYIDEYNNQEIALLDPKAIFVDIEKRPQLIDEWHFVPELWDAVRRECDNSPIKGNFILTGSTTLSKKEQKKKIKHSGTGRIANLKMYTMSLYEASFSTGEASIMDMYNGTQKTKAINKAELKTIAKYIIQGGWPENIKVDEDKIHLIPQNYIQSVVEKDISQNKKIDTNKMYMLLRSLARNETAIIGNSTLLKDIIDNENEQNNILSSRDTIYKYLEDLDRLHLIENQLAYSENYRSRERIGKNPKRHFTDPSLACACLNLTADKLMNDIKTFGFMFEALVERDLRIYMDYLDGRLLHFRDNVTGLEVDAILEFPDGEYAAVEIKLGSQRVNEAIQNLTKFSQNMTKAPKFMCVIIGVGNFIYKDKQSGIYVVPITTLKP
ncbi:MAG TPA: ATP-binding protein [Candidatus Onthocola stercorigallinarum]|jgi:predicted AAA+ superfamily ATPase|nr:ATP-binding protein [Candidatus Onthocola stercorigallinarum]